MPATYEPIATTTLGASASTITFSSIPGTYTDLRLVFVGFASAGTTSKRIQFNADTSTSSTNYSTTKMTGSAGGTVSSGKNTSEFGIRFASDQIGDNNTIPVYSAIDIFSYAGSTNKTVLIETSSDQNGAGYVQRSVGLWRSTAAITSLTLMINLQTFAANTTATLYGIKAA